MISTQDLEDLASITKTLVAAKKLGWQAIMSMNRDEVQRLYETGIQGDRIRFYQGSRQGQKGLWIPGRAIDDDEVYGSIGFRLASSSRDLSGLTPDLRARLYQLSIAYLDPAAKRAELDGKGRALKEKKKTCRAEDYAKIEAELAALADRVRPFDEEATRLDTELKSLLEKCPFESLPPVDVDIHDKSMPPEEKLKIAETLAQEIAKVAGLGHYRICLTGSTGVHVEFRSPVKDVELLRGFGRILQRVSSSLGYWTRSGVKKAPAPPRFTIDDMIMNHQAAGRAREYALNGAPHFKTGRPKSVVKLVEGPMDPTRLLESIEEYRRDSALRSAKKPAPIKREAANEIKVLVGGGEVKAQLKRTAAFASTLGNRGYPNHDLRMAMAGFLGKLSVPQEEALIVVSSIYNPANLNSTPNGIDDAQRAVNTTYQQIRAGLSVTAQGRVREILGEDKFYELLTELTFDLHAAGVSPDTIDEVGRVGFQGQVRQYRIWTASAWGEARKRPTSKKIAFIGMCGKLHEDWVCPQHGVKDSCTLVCQNRIGCSKCMEAWLEVCASHMITRWPAKVAIGEFSYGEGPIETVIERSRRTRKLVQKTIARDRTAHRYFHGAQSVTFVMEYTKIGKLEVAAKKSGSAPPKIATKAEAIEIVLKTLRSQNEEFMGFVDQLRETRFLGEDERWDAVLKYPWLAGRSEKRTIANGAGRPIFSWPSTQKVRDETKLSAQIRRKIEQGVDGTECESLVEEFAPGDKVIRMRPCGTRYERRLMHGSNMLSMKRLSSWRMDEALQQIRRTKYTFIRDPRPVLPDVIPDACMENGYVYPRHVRRLVC